MMSWRSLSCQHACVEVKHNEIWVEDLDSTSGTWVDGKCVERAKVEPGAELFFGAVTATMHNLAQTDSRQLEMESHDQFLVALSSEVLVLHSLVSKRWCCKEHPRGISISFIFYRHTKGKIHTVRQ